MPHLAPQEVVRKRQNIFASLAQRRQHNRNHIKTVIKVFAERAVRHEVRQIAVRRSDDARLEPAWLAPYRRYDAPLDCAQYFALHRRRHIADFVEKKRTVLGFAKCAGAIGGGAGEGTSDVSKKFALQQVRRYRRAVDCDKGFRVAPTVLVQGASDKFLAGSGLAQDQDGRVAVGREADGLLHAAHRFAGADELAGLADLIRRWKIASPPWQAL